MLLEHKANPNISLDHCGSILYRVLDYSDADLRFKITQLLCKYGANVNTYNAYEKTPLYVAVKEGYEDLVELFLPKVSEKEINAPNYYEESLLHIAMQQDHSLHYYSNQVRKIIPKIVLLLLQHKANPDMAYRDGKTRPLHVAVDRNQPEIIKKLVECGARKDFTDKKGRTAYMIAKERKYKQDILDVLYTDTIFKDDEGDDVVVLENKDSLIAINESTTSCIIQ